MGHKYILRDTGDFAVNHALRARKIILLLLVLLIISIIFNAILWMSFKAKFHAIQEETAGAFFDAMIADLDSGSIK